VTRELLLIVLVASLCAWIGLRPHFVSGLLDADQKIHALPTICAAWLRLWIGWITRYWRRLWGRLSWSRRSFGSGF
jgi:hypothetical protein